MTANHSNEVGPGTPVPGPTSFIFFFVCYLMPSYARRLNAQRHRIALRKVFRRTKNTFDKLAIFFHIGLMLISWWIITKLYFASQHDDIPSIFIPIKIERDTWISA